MNQTATKVKQIGGVFIDEEIYLKFKRLAPMCDYNKPTEFIVEKITEFVEENSALLDEEFLSEDELISALEAEGIGRSRSSLNIMRRTGEIPSECYIGGGEANRRIYYRKEKTINKIKELSK